MIYKLKNDKNRILFTILSVFIIGLVTHAFAFLNSNFSHDSLNAFYSSTPEVLWKISLGRFLVPIYQLLTKGKFALPWLIGILSLFYVSVAAYLIFRIFNINSKILMTLISAILVTNLTFIAQTATFIHELDCNMLSLLFSVLAVYFWHTQCNYKGIIIGSLCLLVSVGIYQSYVSVTITLVAFISLISLLENVNFKEVIIRILKAILMVFITFVLYLIASNIACNIAKINPQKRTDFFAIESDNILLTYTNLIKASYIDFSNSIVNRALYNKYFIYIIIGAIILLLAYVFIYTFIKDKNINLFKKILSLGICLFLPLGMNITYVLARGYTHDIIKFSFYFIYIIFLILIWWFIEKQNFSLKYKNIIKTLSAVIVGLIVWQNIVVANTAYIKKNIDQKSALSAMTRVVSLIESHDEYVMGQTPVAFIGASSPYNHLDEFQNLGVITGFHINNPIAFDVSKYFFNTYKAYFRYILNYPINFCDDEIHNKLRTNEQVTNLPTFPNKDCITMIDGVMVVKLGTDSFDFPDDWIYEPK